MPPPPITAEATFVDANRALRIRFTNTGATDLDQLMVQVEVPTAWVDSGVTDAVPLARSSTSPANLRRLDDVVDAVPETWSVWAFGGSGGSGAPPGGEPVAAVRAYSFTSADTGAPRTDGARRTGDVLAAGGWIELTIPVQSELSLDVAIGWSATQRGAGTVSGTAPARTTAGARTSAPAVRPPRVDFYTSPPHTQTLEFGEEVQLFWKIESGRSAVLRGPLSAANSEMPLSNEPGANYLLAEGQTKVRALARAVYVLEAEVAAPDGGPNILVTRTVSLDVRTAETYGGLRVRPQRALPRSQVNIHWAAWGLKKPGIKIIFGGQTTTRIPLTEQNLSGQFEGRGTWPVTLSEDADERRVSLDLDIKGSDELLNESLTPVKWARQDALPSVTGEPLGLACAGRTLALLTRDGLFIARGDDDIRQPFAAVSAQPALRGVALAARDTGYVVARHTDDGELQLRALTATGQSPGDPLRYSVDLKHDLGQLAKRPGASCRVVPFDGRVYVVVDAGGARRVCSAQMDPADVRPEPTLERLPGYEMVAAADALYAVDRRTGSTLRFTHAPDGTLGQPYRARPAPRWGGRSGIGNGVLTPAGSVFVVLGADARPGPADDPGRNAATAPDPDAVDDGDAVDLAYDPTTDAWNTCGRGLDLPAGALVAYRGGDQVRMWAVYRDPTAPSALQRRTLAGAFEELFSPGFESDTPPRDLPIAFDGSGSLTVVNDTPYDLTEVDDVCRAAGLGAVSADGLLGVDPLPARVRAGKRTKHTLAYSTDQTGSATLRFLLSGGPGDAATRYVYEIQLSGSGLSTVRSVFRQVRAGADGPTAVDIPNTAQSHKEGTARARLQGALGASIVVTVTSANGSAPVLAPETGTPAPGGGVTFELRHDTPTVTVTAPRVNAGQVTIAGDFADPSGVPTARVEWSGGLEADVTHGAGTTGVVLRRARSARPNPSTLPVAFQANTKMLWAPDRDHDTFDRGHQMMFGTTPSVVRLDDQDSYAVAFQTAEQTLGVLGPDGRFVDTRFRMLNQTSPSIALSRNGSYSIAFQAESGKLCTLEAGQSVVERGYYMRTFTSPCMVLRDNPQDGHLIAYQANTGQLSVMFDINGNGSTWPLYLPEWSSPSIVSTGGGSYRIAYQDTSQNLCIIDSNNPIVARQPGMMAYTSPSMVLLDTPERGHAVAFQTIYGKLSTIDPDRGRVDHTVDMKPATSPCIALAGGNSYYVAFQTKQGNLCILDPDHHTVERDLGMADQTGPCI